MVILDPTITRRPKRDLTGLRFGELSVQSFQGYKDSRHPYYTCSCDCGISKLISGDDLLSGRALSCGCRKTRLTIQRSLKHGCSHRYGRTRAYRAWCSMLSRCECKTNRDYGFYGARGISVSEGWHDFRTFLRDMGEPPVGLTLERVNNDLGYSVDNCVWATRKVQARNRRVNHWITFNGKTQCLAAWAEELSISYDTLDYRARHHWSTEKLLSAPKYSRKFK